MIGLSGCVPGSSPRNHRATNARMIHRQIDKTVNGLLDTFPAVALLGLRQVVETTLAEAIVAGRPGAYLDLESPAERSKLPDPARYLGEYEEKLFVLDEIHRHSELFQTLRGLIDKGRRKGKGEGRFLILGSASMDLLRQCPVKAWSAGSLTSPFRRLVYWKSPARSGKRCGSGVASRTVSSQKGPGKARCGAQFR